MMKSHIFFAQVLYALVAAFFSLLLSDLHSHILFEASTIKCG